MVTGMGKDKENDKDIWESVDQDDEAMQNTGESVVKTFVYVALWVILACFVIWVLANTVFYDRTAAAAPAATTLHDTVKDRFGTPCWASPNSKNHPGTCTPTPTVPATNTPTSTPAAVPTDTATPLPTDTPAPTPTVCTGPDPYWSCIATVGEFEHEVARLINLHRALPPHDPWWESGIALDFRADLSRAEEGWAEYMVATNQCIHGDFGARAAAEGYTGWAWGNIGSCGYPNPAAAVQGWIDSAGHHWVMDEPHAMTEFGVGAARYTNNFWSTWVTIGCDGGIPCMSYDVPQLP